MTGESFSAYHEHVASSLAREMNAYFKLSDELIAYFNQRDEMGNPPVYRIQDRTAVGEHRLKIIIFCAIYVEALANLYLSLKLTQEQFAAIDRIEIAEKWASIPSLFLASYSIPRDQALWGDLRTLIVQRNAIAHMKPRITNRDEVVHEGNLPKTIRIHDQIIRWDKLPGALIENLRAHDQSLEFQKFRVLSHVDEYAEIRKKG